MSKRVFEAKKPCIEHHMDSEFTLKIKILAGNLLPRGFEAPITLGTVLPMTCEQPVNPRGRVRVFRVRVWVGCFVPQPVPVSIAIYSSLILPLVEGPERNEGLSCLLPV
jgi:hypothetical protein